jgi:hypothetical protein
MEKSWWANKLKASGFLERIEEPFTGRCLQLQAYRISFPWSNFGVWLIAPEAAFSRLFVQKSRCYSDGVKKAASDYEPEAAM